MKARSGQKRHMQIYVCEGEGEGEQYLRVLFFLLRVLSAINIVIGCNRC